MERIGGAGQRREQGDARCVEVREREGRGDAVGKEGDGAAEVVVGGVRIVGGGVGRVRVSE